MVARIPVATYRLQLTGDFDFAAAAAVVPYLKALGISHLYASPFLAARPGSTHGYDIIDHNRLNPELGGQAGFDVLAEALRAADMGLILDFVPNHMGIGFADNAWWLDVLEWGQGSPHAASFDIDWQGLAHRAQPGVLLPILGKSYAKALSDGEIVLRYDADVGDFAAWYFQHKLPINPQRYGDILRMIVGAADAANTDAGRALLDLAQSYQNPNSPSYEEAPAFKQALRTIDQSAATIELGLQAFDPATSAGQMALHRLLERQHFHLAYWRVAFSSINYRRFFDINDLAALRPENPATFRAMHTMVAGLIADGNLHGLRLDHIDGLRDPAQYVRRLQDLARRVRAMPRNEHFYLLIEKIYGNNEPEPHFPGVAGSTGYDRLNDILHVLLDASGLDSLDKTWRAFTQERQSFEALLDTSKQHVIDTMLASEFNVLSRALARIAAGHFASRDFTEERLQRALKAYVREFPYYRTYIARRGVSADDRKTIASTIAAARARWNGPDAEIFDFLEAAITMDLLDNAYYSRPRVRNFALKLQQFTGPLMAKALEDTTFYRYHRLLALNEVGGEPAVPESGIDIFHAKQLLVIRKAPHGLVATATHDTKRGEDARMRILALAELSADWDKAVSAWALMNRQCLADLDGSPAPSLAHQYMIYQALIGAWTGASDATLVKRIEDYAVKAAREGKEQTSWIMPNPAYEKALANFVHGILDARRSAPFLAAFETFCERTSLLGALNSLSQLALKVLSPGVPDFFQGAETWDFSLVDPDNRRSVDYQHRRGLMQDVSSLSDLCASWQDGRIKFALTRKLLEIRNAHADLFRDGRYRAVEMSGRHGDRVIGFTREHRGKSITVLTGRHFAGVTSGGRYWPRGWEGNISGVHFSANDRLRDLITGDQPANGSLSSLFKTLPLCVIGQA